MSKNWIILLMYYRIFRNKGGLRWQVGEQAQFTLGHTSLLSNGKVNLNLNVNFCNDDVYNNFTPTPHNNKKLYYISYK